MRKCLSILLCLVFLFFSTAGSALADFGHRGYGGYHYRSYGHHHSYRGHSAHIWAPLGIGLLSGVVLGSVLYAPPRERTIIYGTPPPVIVYSDPVVINRQNIPPPQPQLVLRRVRTTPDLLNVRSGPDLSASIAGQVRQNSIVDVLGAAPEWLYIRTETGIYGWVMTQYTRDAQGPVG